MTAHDPSAALACPAPARPTRATFSGFVRRARESGDLVVQARMGMSDPRRMLEGLLATKRAAAVTVGTITVDSFTRLRDLGSARRAVKDGVELNGYPIATHSARTTRALLDGVADTGFPIQVRHGSAAPQHIVTASVRAGLHSTEGGPVSYCLPYGRVPLRESVRNWEESCEILLRHRAPGAEPHLETFGGCLMGQLCPPGLLVALSVLEAMFFRAQGLRDISLSYAQQTHAADDQEAVRALRTLARELLPDVDWHIVVYAYMGMAPRTPGGCGLLLDAAAELAAATGAERLIVKTVAEAYRIPTVAENVAALERAARAVPPDAAVRKADAAFETGILDEARTLVGAVLDLHPDIGRALTIAFERGYLDIPYCLHPDNAGLSRGRLGPDGRLRWADTGQMPIRARPAPGTAIHRSDSAAFLDSLTYLARRYDRLALETASRRALDGHPASASGRSGTDEEESAHGQC
ncbi:methylaspartate mutase [Streptomyces sp. 7R007]